MLYLSQPVKILSRMIPAAHLEAAWRGIGSFTVDPCRAVAYYLCPRIEAWLSGYQPFPQEPDQDSIAQAVKKITGEKVALYVGAHHLFFSRGGPWSPFKPALFMPYKHLLRHPHSPFGSEQPNEKLKDNPQVFSDDETRFLIQRELRQIGANNALIRVAIKISLLAAAFTIYATPYGLSLGIPLCLAALGLYIISERCFQSKADQVGDPSVGIATLEKIRRQNIHLREHSRLAKLYLTKHGNNLLDFTHPFLTTRIDRLRGR